MKVRILFAGSRGGASFWEEREAQALHVLA